MSIRGYYRHPAISDSTIVFVSEDDLWSGDDIGGPARRLTANPGSVAWPRISGDGSMIAFVSRDEGTADVHVMPVGGGEVRRLTYFGSATQVVGWTAQDREVVVATDWQQPFAGWLHLWRIPLDGGPPQPLRLGPAFSLTRQPRGRGVVLGRNGFDPARWKRYRGGRTGSLWIDRTGGGEFVELVQLGGNMASPMWIGRRIYFLSDHEGHGNLYSVTPAGRGLTRHTDHDSFYVRHPATDGHRIVYHLGADLWLFDPSSGATQMVELTLPSARPQRRRRFVSVDKNLESVDLHPSGHSIALVSRGQALAAPLWEGAPRTLGSGSSTRHRLASWLPDGRRVAMVTDSDGEEHLLIRSLEGDRDDRVVRRDLGRARSLHVAPAGAARLAVTNHRHELILVGLGRSTAKVVHRSPYGWIAGASWSPDGRWLAFSAPVTRTTANLFLYDTQTGRTHRVDRPRFRDIRPSFSPDGRYLWFLSMRSFDPVPDTVFHDYGFPRGLTPYGIPLSTDAASPFEADSRSPAPPGSTDPGPAEAKDLSDVSIDVDGLADRVVRVPVPDGRYFRVLGAAGRVLMLSFPIEGSLGRSWRDSEGPTGRLESWDLAGERLDTVAEGISGVTVSADGKVMALLVKNRIRVVPSGWKDDKSGKDGPGRETGWLDLSRFVTEVDPGSEWSQMFSEAWRLQRDHFWDPTMGGIDWLSIHERYGSLVARVGSRMEFSDLMWEMQGELGTSHAYELGGDYRPEPSLNQGSLGVDLAYRQGWRIERVPVGDSWDPTASSPLSRPGVRARAGDVIVEVDGNALDRGTHPNRLLVERGAKPVSVVIRRGRSRRRHVIRPLVSETRLRYRDWVERNRSAVHAASSGRVGYLHVPDMQAPGFSEFHRGWEEEVDRDGLIIDVRFNRGGNVSQLLLQKLTRRRLGFRVTRWRDPQPYPMDSPAGPMACLINELAGSDGDLFAHTFSLHQLGPLIGTRTWGGVVGIWPQQALVDGTITTQPEFGTWFPDVGYGVENRGIEPDIPVIVTPQDHSAGRDPQLERAVVEVAAMVDGSPDEVPEFGDFPDVRPPRLPSRE